MTLALAVVAYRISRRALVSLVTSPATPAARFRVVRGLLWPFASSVASVVAIASVASVSMTALSALVRAASNLVHVAVGRPLERLLLLADGFALTDSFLRLLEGEFSVKLESE